MATGTLTDADATFNVDMVGSLCYMTSGDNAGDSREIVTGTLVAVTATTLPAEIFETKLTTQYNLTAQEFTCTRAGNIESISFYHYAEDGTSEVLLGIYDDTGTPIGANSVPGALLASCPPTVMSTSTGWQTISLSSTLAVTVGQDIWIAFCQEGTGFSNTVAGYLRGLSSGVKRAIGPNRFGEGALWAKGLEDPWPRYGIGTGYGFSIYATYEETPADTSKLTFATDFDNNIVVGDRYCVCPVPFKARCWPLQNPELSIFTRWVTEALSLSVENTGGFLRGGTNVYIDNDKWRVGFYRNNGSTLESATDYVDVRDNPSDSAGAVNVDGIDVEPYVEQLASGVKFELKGVEVLISETDSREATA
jgi:hypothetical protein